MKILPFVSERERSYLVLSEVATNLQILFQLEAATALNGLPVQDPC